MLLFFLFLVTSFIPALCGQSVSRCTAIPFPPFNTRSEMEILIFSHKLLLFYFA